MKKLYSILNVSENASQNEIKSAYRKLAVQHHPDKGGDPQEFQKITEAYETLSNEKKKREYDQFGDGGGPNLNNIFNNAFNHSRRQQPPPQQQQQKAPNKIYELHLDLNESYEGTVKKIVVSIEKPCPSCLIVCSNCNGTGKTIFQRQIGPMMVQTIQQPCQVCNSTGKIKKQQSNCGICKGNVYNSEKKNISININRGVKTGHQITVKGLGVQEPCKIPGDLLIKIRLPNGSSKFVRNNNDLIYTTTISFYDIITNKEISLNHPRGTDLFVSLHQFGEIIQHLKQYTIKGMGMPIEGSNPIAFGNALIKFNIKTLPLTNFKELSEEDLVILQKLFN